MTSALAALALLCCALSSPHWRRHGPVTAVEAFVSPPLAVNHNVDAAAALGSGRRPASRGRVQSPAAARQRSGRGGGHSEKQPPQQPLAMSSRLNGADVSEDLSQLNGAAAAPVPSQNTARVSAGNWAFFAGEHPTLFVRVCARCACDFAAWVLDVGDVATTIAAPIPWPVFLRSFVVCPPSVGWSVR